MREIKRMLFEAFSDHPSRIYDSKMAAKQIGIQGNDGRKMVHDLMRAMAAEGFSNGSARASTGWCASSCRPAPDAST